MTTLTAVAAGGTWGTAATWSPAQIPTAADDCVLASTSGAVTISGASFCRSLDCTGYTSTLAHNSAINVGTTTPGTGNVALKLVAGMGYTAAGGSFAFVSTSATQQTMDFGGKTLQGAITISGAGSSYLLSSAITTNSTITHTAGTLNTNGMAISCSAFAGTGAAARTLTLGASTITGTGSNPWLLAGSNLTFNANTSTISLTAAAPVFAGGGYTYNNVTFTFLTAGTLSVTGANTIANLTAASGGSKTGGISFAANQTITGTLTLNGGTAVSRLLITSSLLGTPVTLTCAAVSFSYVDFQDIVGAGAANWNLSAITGLSGDCGGNSGITFTTPTTQTSTGTAAFVWSTHGWTSRVPLPQDDVSIPNAFIAGRTVTMDMPRLGKNISFTCTGTPTVTMNVTNETVYGDVTFGTTVTIANSNILNLAGRGAQTFTSNGNTFTWSLVVNSAGGTYTLQDNLTLASAANFGAQSGTMEINGKTVGSFNSILLGSVTGLSATISLSGGTISANSCTANNATTRSWDFGANGLINITATSGTIWNATGASQSFAGAGTIKIVNATTTTRTFSGGGFTYPVLDYTVAGSTGTLTVVGSNTFTGINFSDASNARSLLFTAGTTNTFTNFNVQGTSGKLMTIDSVTAAAHTLSCAAGTISSDYLSVKNSHAGGGASWYAGANSTDATGNTGWIFTAAPLNLGGSGLLLMGIG